MPREEIEPELHPICVNFLPDTFREKAMKELHEIPEKSKEELQKLRNLLSKDKSLACIDFEEDFLRLYLRYAKYNVSKAFACLRNFVNLRRNYSNFFLNIPDEYFETKASTKAVSVLPYRCPDGCALVVIEIGKWNPDELSLDDLERMILAIFLQLLRCPMTQINGFKLIYDFEDTTVKYLRYFTPHMLYLFYHTAYRCIPARYKETHFINGSVVLKFIWTVMKPFLSTKIRQRITFHSEAKNLLNHFPASILPSKYGGRLNDYHNEDMIKKLNKEHGEFPIGGQPNYY